MLKIKFCDLDELLSATSLKKFIEEFRDEIIVFIEGDKIKAYTAVCPHMAGEINYINMKLVCKWHGLEFNKSGVCERFDGKIKLIEYKVEIENKEIFVTYEF